MFFTVQFTSFVRTLVLPITLLLLRLSTCQVGLSIREVNASRVPTGLTRLSLWSSGLNQFPLFAKWVGNWFKQTSFTDDNGLLNNLEIFVPVPIDACPWSSVDTWIWIWFPFLVHSWETATKFASTLQSNLFQEPSRKEWQGFLIFSPSLHYFWLQSIHMNPFFVSSWMQMWVKFRIGGWGR